MNQTVMVTGAYGKMGKMACATIEKHPDFTLLKKLGREDCLEKALMTLNPQIVIDLTTADSVYANSLTIIKHNACPVIGTSGLLDTQIASLQELAAAKHLGGIIVPNFSIGAVLMMQFAKLAARFMSEVEIIEAHHPQKLDAPSGTAIKTAEMISSSRKEAPSQITTREIIKNARGAEYKNINIHSIRLPGYLASQQVIFGNSGETLSINHNSIDRSCFMPGLIMACQAVTKLDNLVYGLESLINLED